MVEEEEMPHGTRVHIIRIWSDGFMAHHGKIDSEYNNIQLFTLSVLASEDGNAKHHTMPFALGFKQKDHSTILNQLLQEMQWVGVPMERYYGQDKHPFHSVFFLQIVSNDYPERCANAVLANLDTFTHRWGYSGKYNENVTPSCQKCELGRVEHFFRGNFGVRIEDCMKYSDWWSPNHNTAQGCHENIMNYPFELGQESIY